MERKYLTRPEAAAFLNDHGFPVSKTTLGKYATVGGGPDYQIFGYRALYTPDELLRWAKGKLKEPRRSTSTG